MTSTTTSPRKFALHFGEMLLAMFVGMAVLGGLASLALAAAGSGYSELSPAAQVLLMGATMTGPMAGWMAYRGHDGARNAEMAASMAIPTLIVAAIAAAGGADAEGAMALLHAIMIPAMLGVMVWRYPHYAGGHEHA